MKPTSLKNAIKNVILPAFLMLISNSMFSQTLDSLKNKIKFEGYVDAYFARYSDLNDGTKYQAFATTSPRNNQIGINLAQVSAKYSDSSARGIVTLQYGDIPISAWSGNFNMIQEANVGFRLSKKRNIWFDAGFFRTHIGYESIQPRENIASSLAITTFYEPYFLSGAKLNVPLNQSWLIQFNVFNSFSTFVSDNQVKSYGWELYYTHSEDLMFTSNFFITHNFQASFPGVVKPRLYVDFFGKYTQSKYELVGEFNISGQQKSVLTDQTKTAYMRSGLLTGKYKFNAKKAVYARYAGYNDKNQILTGTLTNKDGKLTGLTEWEITTGLEYKPVENSYIRLEYRHIQITNDAVIFYNQKNSREEFMICTGLWF